MMRRWAAGVGLVALLGGGLIGSYAESQWHTLEKLAERLWSEPPEWELMTPHLRTVPDGDVTLVDLAWGEAAYSAPDLSTRESFLAWQEEARADLRALIFGTLEPCRPTAELEVLDEVALDDGLVRQAVRFTSCDDSSIPGYLFRPPGMRNGPGIVVIPGHVTELQSGLAEVTGLAASRRSAAPYQDGVARDLAAAGFTTLTFELRGFGLLGEPVGTEHRLLAYNALLAGTSYKAILAQDLAYAVSALGALDEVDATRIGLTGASFGGELAVTYAAIDPGVRAVVAQAFGGRTGPIAPVIGDRSDQPHYCHLIPGFNRRFRIEDLFYLVAPRSTLGLRGQAEVEDSTPFADTVGRAWTLLGREDAFEYRSLPGGHEYFVAPAIEFFRAHL